MNISDATINFIKAHRQEDINMLALRYGNAKGQLSDKELDLPFALDQIAGWQTARIKLPAWAATEGIIYPPHINMEQCSSEETARYKASLLGGGSLLIDLTGGFGVDFSFMSRGFKHAIYVEQNERLCAITQQNFHLLSLENVEVVCDDAVSFLENISTDNAKTVIYLDPSRRDVHGRKVYGIEDCTPDVITLKEKLLEKAEMVMIKLSPMLDWHAAVKAFGGNCHEVHIVSVDNECKELLLILRAETCEKVRLVCVNSGDSIFKSVVDIYNNDAPQLLPDVGNIVPGSYLYVPNASIMKGGIYGSLTVKFPISMIGTNSHLFISTIDIDNFPGRKFLVRTVTTMNKRELKQKLSNIDRANISVRNFPLSVAELRKRLKLKDGGEVYLFATTIGKQHIMLVTQRA